MSAPGRAFGPLSFLRTLHYTHWVVALVVWKTLELFFLLLSFHCFTPAFKAIPFCLHLGCLSYLFATSLPLLPSSTCLFWFPAS